MGTRRPKTAFEVDLEAELANVEFAKEYRRTRAEIEAVDRATIAFLRGLDRARINRRLSKAELARRIGAKPPAMRRLLLAKGQNPTLTTLMRVAAALGMELEIRDAAPSVRHRRAG